MSLAFILVLLLALNLFLNIFQSYTLASAAYYFKDRLLDPIDALSERLTKMNDIADEVERRTSELGERLMDVKQVATNKIVAHVSGALDKFKEVVQTATKEEI